MCQNDGLIALMGSIVLIGVLSSWQPSVSGEKLCFVDSKSVRKRTFRFNYCYMQVLYVVTRVRTLYRLVTRSAQ